MIYFADGRDHAIRFLIIANILPLLFLYYEYVSSLIIIIIIFIEETFS